MRTRTTRLKPVLIQWFGVFGAPLAWVLQHIAGFAVTLASCERIGTARHVALDPVTIAITVPAVVIAAAAGACALYSFFETRGVEKDDPPPAGRRHFLALVGVAITPLFIAIIIMSGSGVLSLPECRQS